MMDRRRLITMFNIAFILVLVLATTASASTLRKTTVNYAPNSGSSLTRLDIYSETGRAQAPVLIYLHGGAWTTGDKSRVHNMPAHFNSQGFVFVAVNYRLVPKNTVMDQITDIDHALGWIARNIGPYGGNPDNLHLIGHSAGAHLVALTATAPRAHTARLLKSGALRTVIANDTRTYDIPRFAALYPVRGLPKLYRKAFGNDPAVWRQLSPIYHLRSARRKPAFLILYSTEKREKSRHLLSKRFADAVRRAGGQAHLFKASGDSHRAINISIGKANRLTRAIDAFLAKHR